MVRTPVEPSSAPPDPATAPTDAAGTRADTDPPTVEGPASIAVSPPARSNRARWWRIARFALGLAIGGVAIWAVSGKTGELTDVGHQLAHLQWGWAVFALIAEVASYLAFAGMQQRLLAAGKVRVRIRPITGVTLAGNVLQTSLPGGIVVSAAWTFRQFRRFGADEVLSGWVLVAMTATSFISLTLLAAVGLAMAASTGNSLDLVSVILGLVVVAALVGVAWLKRGWVLGHSVKVVALAQRLFKRPEGDPQVLVDDAMARLAAISPTWADWGWSLLWAAANWIFDMGCLMLAFQALNVDVPWRGLLLAYAAAQLATNLPITPGGLGVVEGSLTVALVAFGGSQASTVAAVLIYRLLSFWLVLPAGWGTLGALTWMHRRQGRLEVETT